MDATTDSVAVPVTDADKLHHLADWFDAFDRHHPPTMSGRPVPATRYNRICAESPTVWKTPDHRPMSWA